MPDPVQFTSKTLALLKRLDGVPQGFRVHLLRTVDLENQLTVGHIAKDYLSRRGPDTLGVVTNRLRSSLWASKARTSSGSIISSIGSNVAYLAPHEFGFDGPVRVRSFVRRVKALDQFRTVRITGEFDLATGEIIRRPRVKKQRITSGVQVVRAHTRHVHFAERAPVRRGIADRIGNYSTSLERATVAFLTGGQS